jgi:GNAT superfamily N-acetyltransferase
VIKLTYRPVSPKDFRWLYRQLKARPAHVNISHRAMPTYAAHVAFCKGHPYAWWAVARQGRTHVGHVYVTRAGEVGLFVAAGHQRKGIGSQMLREAERLAFENGHNHVLANVAPGNEVSQRFFRGRGYKLIQLTYERLRA